MADGRKHTTPNRSQLLDTDEPKTVNQARAVRVAELINDYRTLLLHISQQQVEAPPQDLYEEGFVVLRECHIAAQSLVSSNYHPCPVSGQANAETEKAELQR
jgi:hypothetical protein